MTEFVFAQMIPYLKDMAALSKTEKLIRDARTSNDEVLYRAFELTDTYFKARALFEHKKKEDYVYFRYLYCRNHKGKSYRYIAEYILYTSVSTLEDRRTLFQKIFNYYLDFVKANAVLSAESAVTKNE